MLAQKSLKPECENLKDSFIKHCKYDPPCHSDSNLPLCSPSLQSPPPHPPTVAFPTAVFHCGQTPVVLQVNPWVLFPHLSWQRPGCPLSTPLPPRSCLNRRLFTSPFLWTSEPGKFLAFSQLPTASSKPQLLHLHIYEILPSRIMLYPSRCCFQQSAQLLIHILWALWNPASGIDDFCAQEHE